MLIRRYTSELVEDNEYVDKVLYYDEDGGKLTPFFGMINSVREQNFDVVIHTQPRPRLAFITRFSGIPVRIGTGYRWYSFLFNRKVYEHRKDAQRHELEYNLNLLSALDFSIDGLDIEPKLKVQNSATENVQSLLHKSGIQPGERLVLLHPGSGGSAREWGNENFGKLGQRLAAIPNIRVLVTGSKNEEARVNEVVSIAGSNAIPMIGFGGLREFAALAKLSALFISNSTGPIHIAAAVGTPVIGLYPQLTAQNSVRWGPYTKKKTVFSPVNKPVDCKQCLQSSRCECMETISMEEVNQAAMKYLGIKA